MGNFFDQDFEMLDKPMPCKSQSCPCNEWAFLLVDQKKQQAEPQKPKFNMGSFIVETIEKKDTPKAPILIDRTKIPPHHVFITWDIHYGCNYRCTYCNTPKSSDSPDKWDRDRMKVAYPGLEALIEIWKDVYRRYGSCEVHITGGEPFVYPKFIEFIRELSKIHTLEIITNLSCDVEKIIKNVTADRVRIGTTFHPEFADLKKFLDKHMKLRESGFETWANYVAYPAFLKDMPGYKSEFDKLGIYFYMQPYLGFYEGREYPAGYTDSELAYIKQCYDDEDIVNKKTIEWKTGVKQRNLKGKSCRMGQMYAKIYPVGDAYRCCADGCAKIGNLFDGSFELYNDPLACDSEHCFCWRCMTVGQENNWAQHWVIPQKKSE
jgi:MoaA/NifB/PqqE/SkfB family radical SAM enzyme